MKSEKIEFLTDFYEIITEFTDRIVELKYEYETLFEAIIDDDGNESYYISKYYKNNVYDDLEVELDYFDNIILEAQILYQELFEKLNELDCFELIPAKKGNYLAENFHTLKYEKGKDLEIMRFEKNIDYPLTNDFRNFLDLVSNIEDLI